MTRNDVTAILCMAVLMGGCKDCGSEQRVDEPEDEGAPAVDSEGSEGDELESAAPGGAPEAPRVWTRSGEEPDDEKVIAAVEADGEANEVSLVGEGEPLGDGRFLRVATRGPRILALMVSSHEAEAQIEARVPLPVERLSTSQGPVVVQDVEMDDLEGDGEEEIHLTLSYHTHPASGGGGSTREQHFVLDLEPVARVAFTVLTRVEPVEGAGAVTKAKIEFEDRDSDGHADVVLTGKQCIAQACEPMDVVFFYNPASDSWAEKI